MATTTREITINLRARAAQKDLIDRAAEAQGKNRTEFVLEAACERAEQVLLDKTFFALDEDKHKEFAAILEAPLANQERVMRLLTKKAPWER
jgi:uncharacterized protein (DUF1778 family)